MGGVDRCGPFVKSLTTHFADRSLRLLQIIERVRGDVKQATRNKEQPSVGFMTVHDFSFYPVQTECLTLVANRDYSHGLAGDCIMSLSQRLGSSAGSVCTGAIAVQLPPDGHKQWRKRINRLTIKANI